MKTIATYSPSGNTKPLRPFLVVLGERSMIQHAYNVLVRGYFDELRPFAIVAA